MYVLGECDLGQRQVTGTLPTRGELDHLAGDFNLIARLHGRGAFRVHVDGVGGQLITIAKRVLQEEAVLSDSGDESRCGHRDPDKGRVMACSLNRENGNFKDGNLGVIERRQGRSHRNVSHQAQCTAAHFNNIIRRTNPALPARNR